MIRIACLLLAVFVCAACSTSSNTKAELDAPPEGGYASIDVYRIGVGDQVDVVVRKSEDLSVSGPVRPDGRISVPLIGDIAAVGRTADELADAIEAALKEYLRNPEVTVVIRNPVSSEYIGRVRITGSVNQPLSLPFRQGMTVMDLVLEAGGLTEFAKANDAKLYRKVNGELKTYSVRTLPSLRRHRVIKVN